MEATAIWATTSNKGNTRYYTFSYNAGRAVQVKRADAELGLLTGTHELGEKPFWVGK